MKNVLSVATILGMLSGVASAAPYVTPFNVPGATTPYDMQPVYCVEGLYGFAGDSDDPDTWGGRLSFNLYSDGRDTVRQQFTLGVAAMWGDKSYRDEYGKFDVDMTMVPITAGYYLNIELTDNVLMYLGGRAGYAFCDVDFEGESADGDGFTFSAGAGLKFQCSDDVYVNVGYEFGKTYMKGDMDYNYAQHIISVGVGFRF